MKSAVCCYCGININLTQGKVVPQRERSGVHSP